VNPPKFLLDENLSPSIAVTLQREGADIVHVRDRGLNAGRDPQVFKCAYDEDRIVVTFNVGDFENLAASSIVHCGLVLLPSGSIVRKRQLALVRQAWEIVSDEHEQGRDMVNRVLYLEQGGGSRLEDRPTGRLENVT
jgi:predicted nuclease of predicted toxin-antitoxin system